MVESSKNIKRKFSSVESVVDAVEDAVKFGGPEYIIKAQRLDISLLAKAQTFFENSTAHGVNRLFEEGNGLGRILFWLIVWVAAGFFVVSLVVPVFTGYLNKEVNTVLAIRNAESQPIPIVTICPLGNGWRCDCWLWEELACAEERSGEPISIRDYRLMRCVDLPMNCTADGRFNAPVDMQDPCLRKGAVDYKELARRVQQRQKDGAGDYLTVKEMNDYAGKSFADVALFTSVDYRGKFEYYNNSEVWNMDKKVTTAGGDDRNPFVRCAQIDVRNSKRIATSKKQHVVGYRNGLVIELEDTADAFFASSSYQIRDGANAVGAVLVGINVPEYDTLNPGSFEVVQAGMTTNIGLTRERTELLEGYGTSECDSTAKQSVLACQDECKLKGYAELCECSDEEGNTAASNCPVVGNSSVGDCFVYTPFLGQSDELTLETLPGEKTLWTARQERVATIDRSCTERCKRPCIENTLTVNRHGTTPFTREQWDYWQRLLAGFMDYIPSEDSALKEMKDSDTLYRYMLTPMDELPASVDWGFNYDGHKGRRITLRIGWDSFKTRVVVEEPKQELGGLLGSLGGNLGLWCGLSLMTLVELLEFGFFGALASWGRRNCGGCGAGGQQESDRAGTARVVELQVCPSSRENEAVEAI